MAHIMCSVFCQNIFVIYVYILKMFEAPHQSLGEELGKSLKAGKRP